MQDTTGVVNASDVKRYLGNKVGQRMSNRVALTQEMIDRYNAENPQKPFQGGPERLTKNYYNFSHQRLDNI